MSDEINLATASEAQLREYEVPWSTTTDELLAIVTALTERQHDYGTCVYAMSIAATAAFYYVAKQLGVTGFQASCADMDVVTRTRHLKGPWRITDHSKLLYPQYCDDEHYPTWQQSVEAHKEWLADEARKLLAEPNRGVPSIREHWEYLSALHVVRGD